MIERVHKLFEKTMLRKYSEYDDRKLVGLMKSRKAESDAAFSELYRRYSSIIHTYCRYMMRGNEQAEDIFQETFIRFFKKIKEDHPDTNVKSYLFTIARNLCYNYTRDKKITVPIEGDELSFDGNKEHDNNEMFDLIMMAVELLDDKYKEAFILRELDGLPYQEIANILAVTLSGAKTRVLRAKEKLVVILEPYMKDFKN